MGAQHPASGRLSRRGAVDLTGWNPRLQLRRDGKVLADLSDCVTLDSHGHVDVSVTDERSSTLMPCAGAWDLLLESPQGEVTRLVYGEWVVASAISRKELS